MEFHKEYTPEFTPGFISIHRPVVLLGSCFSDNILNRMSESLWNVSNPGGALYNPLSVCDALERLLFYFRDVFADSIIKAPDGFYHSRMFDTHLYGNTRKELIEQFEARSKDTVRMLEQGADIIITFGSAYCYFLTGYKNYAVGNCHKQPQNLFELRLLSIREIVFKWKCLIQCIRNSYPLVRFIFTISPIRYASYGLENNSLSKSILRLAIDEIVREEDNVSYFPAYEIMLDDLRDYRFYADDLQHPSSQAVDYIWEKFQMKYLSVEERELLKRGNDIYKGLQHRPILPENHEQRVERMRRLWQRYELLRKDWPEAHNFFRSFG